MTSTQQPPPRIVSEVMILHEAGSGLPGTGEFAILDARSPGSGLGVWSPGKLRKSSTLVRAVSRPDPAVKRGSRGATCATSAASNLASSRTKEREREPRLRHLCKRLQQRRGAADLGYGSRCTVAASRRPGEGNERSYEYGRLPAAPPRRALCGPAAPSSHPSPAQNSAGACVGWPRRCRAIAGA